MSQVSCHQLPKQDFLNDASSLYLVYEMPGCGCRSVLHSCVIVLHICVIVLHCSFHKTDLQVWFLYRCNKLLSVLLIMILPSHPGRPCIYNSFSRSVAFVSKREKWVHVCSSAAIVVSSNMTLAAFHNSQNCQTIESLYIDDGLFYFNLLILVEYKTK